MTRLLTNESLATYATVNLNRVSRGDNGSDHTVFLRYSPVSSAVRPTTSVSPKPHAGRPAADAALEEGYSSAAGLGLVLVAATVIGAAAIGALVLRAALALLG